MFSLTSNFRPLEELGTGSLPRLPQQGIQGEVSFHLAGGGYGFGDELLRWVFVGDGRLGYLGSG